MLRIQNSTAAFLKFFADKESMTISIAVSLFDRQAKQPILARFTNFLIFNGFQKDVATEFLRISKIPVVEFEIYTFSCYLFKNFCFSMTQTHAMGIWILGKNLKIFLICCVE